MGSNSSKANNESVASLKADADSNSSDPRSPTPEIARTPLQGKTGSKHNITKNCDLRKTFDTANSEEKVIHNNPILSAVIKNHLQSYDPRSPTQDFERTPVIITSKIDEIRNGKKIRRQYNSSTCASPPLHVIVDNETCDDCTEAQESCPELVPKKLCDDFYDMSLNGTIKETEEPLGSSTASNEVIEENITPVLEDNKPTKLLETNFDYDCDADEHFEDSCEAITSPCDSIAAENQLSNAVIFKIIDPRSPSIGIERTPLVVANVEEDSNEDNVEEMSDDSLIKVLQSTNAELRHTGTKLQDNNGDELLVYEDETTNINDTPKKSKSTSNNGSRTPLSCMKNKDGGHGRSKSVNMLYDPKNQKQPISKIPKRVSHIPRLKSLTKPATHFVPAGSSVSLKNISKASSIGGDCENTPPHSHRDRWDKESSIVL